MNGFELKSPVLRVKSIKRKTRAIVLRDIKENELIQLSVTAQPVGSKVYGGSSYAVPVIITRLLNNECTSKTFNEIGLLYDTFELEPVLAYDIVKAASEISNVFAYLASDRELTAEEAEVRSVLRKSIES